MKKIKIVLLAALFVYHFTIVYTMVYLEKHVFDLLKYLDYLRYGAYLGLFLFMGYLLYNFIEFRNLQKRLSDSEHSNQDLKAKLYDQSEDEKKIDASLKAFGDSLKNNE